MKIDWQGTYWHPAWTFSCDVCHKTGEGLYLIHMMISNQSAYLHACKTCGMKMGAEEPTVDLDNPFV